MIQHTEDCDDLYTGRAVRALASKGIHLFDTNTLGALGGKMRNNQGCDCAKLALGRVSTELTTVRKRKAALQGARSVSGDIEANLTREAELLAERDELRAIIAGTR